MADSARFDGSVTYALDRADVDAVRATVLARYGKQTRSVLPFGIVFIVVGAVMIVLSFVGPHRRAAWPYGIDGVVQIVIGTVYVLQARRPRYLIVRRPRVGVLSTLAWNARGLSFGRAAGAAVMTTSAGVSRLDVSDSMLQVHRSFKPAIVVPRRMFADGGDAFVAYVEDRIIGKRLLVRASPAHVPYRPLEAPEPFRR